MKWMVQTKMSRKRQWMLRCFTLVGRRQALHQPRPRRNTDRHEVMLKESSMRGYMVFHARGFFFAALSSSSSTLLSTTTSHKASTCAPRCPHAYRLLRLRMRPSKFLSTCDARVSFVQGVADGWMGLGSHLGLMIRHHVVARFATPRSRVGRRGTALRARPPSCKRSRWPWKRPRGRGRRRRRRCRALAPVQVKSRSGGTMFTTARRKGEVEHHHEVLGVPADLQLVGRAESETDPRGKYSIKRFNGGAFAAVEVVWEKSGQGKDGNGCKAEGGAMLSMSSGVDFDAKMAQGFLNACCLCCCAGESFFLSHFYLRDDVPTGTRADVLLAPPLPGDILMLRCEPGRPWLMQKGAFLACDFDVDIGVHTQGFRKGLFSGQGFFILKAQGTGLLLLASYGSIVKYELKEGEARKVDNGYLVAWPADMKYKIGKSSKSIRSSIFSGEGLACKFYGPGTLYIQTRALDSLARALTPLLSENANAASDGI